MSEPDTDLVSLIARSLAEITSRPPQDFSEDTPLIGSSAHVKSREIVELFLALEDALEARGVAFDFSSDSAMSDTRSHFRTVGTLARYLDEQIRGSQ